MEILADLYLPELPGGRDGAGGTVDDHGAVPTNDNYCRHPPRLTQSIIVQDIGTGIECSPCPTGTCKGLLRPKDRSLVVVTEEASY